MLPLFTKMFLSMPLTPYNLSHPILLYVDSLVVVFVPRLFVFIFVSVVVVKFFAVNNYTLLRR